MAEATLEADGPRRSEPDAGTSPTELAHELNNLLMGIGSCARVALRDLPADSQARPFVEQIRAAVVDGGALSKRLRALADRPPREGALAPGDGSVVELRAAEHSRSEALLQTATDAIVCSDATGVIESFNAAAERIFGYAAEEVLGQNVRILMPAALRQNHDDFISRYLSGGEPRAIGRGRREATGRRRDGRIFPLDVSVGEFWEGGQRKFMAILTDVTQRHHAAAALQESEARFRQLAENVDDVLILHQRQDRRILYANPAFERVWGRPAQDLLGTDSVWLGWLHADDRLRVAEAYERLLAGERFDEEYRICRPDGEIYWVRSRVFPVTDADGSVRRDVCVQQDITAEKLTEDADLQAHKMEVLGAFATGVAHDFGNLLQAILGCLSVARRPNTSPKDAHDYLERAARAAQNGAGLTAQLLSFARPQPRPAAATAADPVVQRAGRLIEHLVTERIAVNIKTGAPDAFVGADEVALEQILLNLAANARDAMPGGGTLFIHTEENRPSVAVAERCDLDPAQTYLRLTVRDTGEGMSAETRARIFEPFFSTKAAGRGTGVGMSTVFGTTRQLGGCVDVDSVVGRGTTVAIYLPLCARPMAALGATNSVPARLPGTALLVEDAGLVRMTVRLLLEELGLHVIEAEDGAAALAAHQAHGDAIDVVVSDIVLPHSSGTELAAQLRQRRPELPILFISANPDRLDDSVTQTAPTALLRKPFGQGELAAALARLMESTAAVGPSPTAKTILLVEDDTASRMALEAVLRADGYEVLAHASPAAALDAAARLARVDLLVSDLGLPEMGGEELAQRLRALYGDLRVVLISGRPREHERADAFIRKPFDLDLFVDVVARCLAP